MSVFDFINEGRYENKVPFHVVTARVDENNMTVRNAREHQEEQKRRKREQERLHHEESNRLCGIFKDDLENEYGTKGHPKADKLFSLAWEQGHSSGYHEVACAYDDLAGLLQP